MLELLFGFLFGRKDQIAPLLIALGALILFVAFVLHRHMEKKYAATWAFVATRSQDAAGGPYREGKITSTHLVPGEAPWIARAASLSGHALSLYLAIFLPFFLPIFFEFPTSACLTALTIAVGVATRRSALEILDGSAPPGEPSGVLPTVLLLTGGVVLFLWKALDAREPMQITIFHLALPIWAAVQAALIQAATNEAFRIARARGRLGR